VTEPRVVNGPTADDATGGVIYQVTLAQGLVLTNPAAFGAVIDDGLDTPGPVISEAGQVLAPEGAGRLRP